MENIPHDKEIQITKQKMIHVCYYYVYETGKYLLLSNFAVFLK